MKLNLGQTFSEIVKDEICSSLLKNEQINQFVIFAILKNNAEYNLMFNSIEFKTKYISVIKLFQKFVSQNSQFELQIAKSNQKTLKDHKTNYLIQLTTKNNEEIEKINFNNFVKNEINFKHLLIGIFLSGGSVNNPIKGNYHLEVRIVNFELKDLIIEAFNFLGFKTKLIFHKNKWIIYFKKSTEISDLLKMFNANESMYFLEDNRIERDMLNSCNRLTNLEMYNIKKISKAAVEQSKMCEVVSSSIHYNELSAKEKLYCAIRVQYPHISMQKICDEMNKKLPVEQKITKGSLSHIATKIKNLYYRN